jgi:hypothetical protein
MSAASAKAKIARHEKALAEAEAELAEIKALEEAWGTDGDFRVDYVLAWKRNYGTRKIYSFVALKTNIGWFITGRNSLRQWTYAELVEEHFRHAVEEGFEVVISANFKPVQDFVARKNEPRGSWA